MRVASFDLVVIGGGPGGYVAAIRAAQLGMSVACVEKRATLGGTCLNVGCIPSKALLDSSELFSVISHQAARHGIKVAAPQLDLAGMLGRKDSVVKELTQGVAFLLKKNKVEVFHGTGRIASSGSVNVELAAGGTASLACKRILLATGSEPVNLPFLPFDGKNIVSSTEALSFEKVPEHLVLVGAGYIGLELGSVWKRLGAKVTVVEYLPRILAIADGEMAGLLQKSLEKQGMSFQLGTKVTGHSMDKGGLSLKCEADGKPLAIKADKVLVCVGRKPYTKGLGLEDLGIQPDAKTGQIPVDPNFQTKVAGVYAIGDLVAGPMLAHKAEDEAVAFAERLAGQKPHLDHGTIPSVIYTWPELASVGRNEEELKAAGVEYKVGKYPFKPNARAKCMGEDEGVAKVLADAVTDRVLGVHILGPRASDLIAEAVTIMEFRGSSEDIARICHGHPTLSEALKEAALAVHKRAIHA
jgi:dihydrolipoamide dehydrogenase